jgi:hypothetical protein
MTSRDYGFLTLRNTTAYQPTGNPVPPNNIFVTSTNGVAIFSNNISISTLNTDIINTSSLITPIWFNYYISVIMVKLYYYVAQISTLLCLQYMNLILGRGGQVV